MNVGNYESFDELGNELLARIDEGHRFGEIWGLVRQLESLRRVSFGIADDRNIWDGCGVRFEEHTLVLVTHYPDRDYFHEAKIYHDQVLSDDEENELREHLRIIIKAWLRYSKRLPVRSLTAELETDTDTKTDKEKKVRKKRELSAAAGLCGAFVKKELVRDPTQNRIRLVKCWHEENKGGWIGKIPTVNTLDRTLQDHPDSWRPADTDRTQTGQKNP